MKLITHLQQGSIRYFFNNNLSFTVLENPHYRWLNFGHVTQSIMLKRKPYLLTLPHQYFIVIPLLFISPNRVIEFGLGGGNLLRFLAHYFPQITYKCIEQSSDVITCFHRFFNPQHCQYRLHNQSCKQWLHTNTLKEVDWIIYDIYSSENNDVDLNVIRKMLSELNTNSWLTINIPSDKSRNINHTLQKLNVLKQQRSLVYFQVPHYKNTIIHLHPKSISTLTQKYIPSYYTKRAINLWQYRCLDR
ncbi:hypothetical protein [Thalassotalea sediminis]|uniref:hypothetical protein n=1 Tax=Thalassotalea sediminis TaxID=1759089 RepID=UPI0025741269|nr:hypothetical protein [Thalassotalea sediminis]